MAALLPHMRVDRDVCVDERVVKPLEAVLPAKVQIVDEKLRDDVTEVIGDESATPKTSHARVNELLLLHASRR